jgi:hypothetical protein
MSSERMIIITDEILTETTGDVNELKPSVQGFEPFWALLSKTGSSGEKNPLRRTKGDKGGFLDKRFRGLTGKPNTFIAA